MKTFFTTALLLLSIASFTQKKNATTTVVQRIQSAEAELQKVLNDWKGAGFAVAVVDKNGLVYSKGFGVKDANTKAPVTPNTLFAIGSSSKAFTSTLIGQLVAEGKLSYDEPVRQYLPSLQFYTNEMNSLITLRDMMCHRTGLPRHDMSWYFNQSEDRDSLIQRVKYQEPTFRPKEKWQYNNFMFLAQGVVAEKMTGKTWEQLTREKLFTPLKMMRSNMPYSAVKNDNDLASPHVSKKDSSLKIVPHYNIAGMGPAGAIYSSVNEMAHWVQAWINGGIYDSLQVIPKVHHREAMSAQMVSGSGIPDSLHADISGASYGFGWFLTNYRGHYRVEHGGAIDGFIASTGFYPTDSIGIIVLSNQANRSIPAIVRNLITDKILDLPYYDWHKEYAASAAKAKEANDKAKANAKQPIANTKPSHALADYEGIYTHPGYGSFEVLVRNDSLFAQTMTYTMWLRHWHYDIFMTYEIEANESREPIDTSERSSVRFRFNTNMAGDIGSMHVYGLEAPQIMLEFMKTPKAKPISPEALQAYTGSYDLNGTTISVYLKDDNKLFVEVPGQPPYELISAGNDKFNFKALSGYAVQFEKAGDKPATALTFLQPNGNFKATRK